MVLINVKSVSGIIVATFLLVLLGFASYIGISGIYHSVLMEHVHDTQDSFEDLFLEKMEVLMSEHKQLLDRQETLMERQQMLMDQHQVLETQHGSLHEDHMSLHEDHDNLYNNLHGDHDSLHGDHDSLHDDHDTLKNQHVALLAHVLNLMQDVADLENKTRSVDASCPVSSECEIGMSTQGHCDGVSYKHEGASCDASECYDGPTSCDGQGSCIGAECRGDCHNNPCPSLGLFGVNIAKGDYIKPPVCSAASETCMYEHGNSREGARVGVHSTVAAALDFSESLVISLNETLVGFSCTNVDHWRERCFNMLPDTYRDCMVSEPVCVVGVVLETLPEEEHIGPIWDSCVARFACSDTKVQYD